jgi:3-oxoacyl-[acyl-carrier-protein] synthase III
MKVLIKAIETYLPPAVEDGNTLKKDNPTWRVQDIEEKTGIIFRHISGPDMTTTDMAEFAVKKLLESGVLKEDIDFLILVTQSPEYVLPSSACILQDRLGLKSSCMAFDVNLGCSGFIYGLAIGASLIEGGLAKKGLLVCSEKYTKYIDRSDRTCRPLFSDGASAVLLASSDRDMIGPFVMGTDGSGYQSLIVPSDDTMLSDKKAYKGKLFMNGAKVFMFSMATVPKCVTALLNKAERKIGDIDLFIFHQASKLVMDSIIRHLELPEEKVFVNYQNIGNTVSASIPIAVKDALDEERLRNGDMVMLIGFGVGYSWGGCLVNWDVRA